MVFPISISDPSSVHPIHKQNLLVQPLRHPEYDLSFYIVVWAAIFLHLNYYKYLQTKLSPSPAPRNHSLQTVHITSSEPLNIEVRSHHALLRGLQELLSQRQTMGLGMAHNAWSAHPYSLHL